MPKRNISSALMVLSVLLSFLWVAPANAVLVGTQIGVAGSDILSTITPSSPIIVNGQGTEDFTAGSFGPPPFPGFPPVPIPILSVDVFDTGIDLTAVPTSSVLLQLALPTLSFTGLNWGGAGTLADVTVGVNDFGDSNISILFDPITNPTAFTIEFTNVAFTSPGDTLSVVLTPSHAVPTPSAMLLMGTGLVGLIGVRTWQKRQS